SRRVPVSAAKQSSFRAATSTGAVKQVNTSTYKSTRNPQQSLKNKGIFDSGCSRHMTGNKDFLIDYQVIDGGFVAFGRSARSGIEAIRLFLAYASFMNFLVYQMDVKSAFLYDTIEEEVYVSQPPGFVDPEFPEKVYKVEKALYGLHQAPRAWYETLSTYLLDNVFYKGQFDKTLFIKRVKDDILLVQVYVDEIIFGSTKKSLCTDFEQIMHKRFQMSSMGELTFFLGLQVKQKEDGIFISQDKYVGEILKKFGFSSIRTASTPMETNKALTKDEDGEDVDIHLYRSMIGSLMYLTSSRPDIMFSVCACSRFQVQPKVSHLNAVKRIFRYLKGRPKLGLWYPKDSPFILEAFSDSDYAGASLDRKSTTGGCQFLGSRLISWQCKKQTVVANSTTEAEYIAASHCCGQVLWIQNQMLDYGYNFMQTKIHVDNESAICVVKNPVYHSKTKHIEIRHHFIRDSYEKRLIEMVKIHTDNNVADLLTKAFDGRLMVFKCSGVYTSAIWIEVGSVERAITTVASLDGWQSQAPRHNRGAPDQTRSKRVLEQPIEPALSEGHTSRSGRANEHQLELPIMFESSDDDLDEEDASKQGRNSDKIKSMFKDSDFDVLDAKQITTTPSTPPTTAIVFDEKDVTMDESTGLEIAEMEIA
ncbi:putative ribonuclease H-like domain-containing protein, partial [Tanacetum coccineum]